MGTSQRSTQRRVRREGGGERDETAGDESGINLEGGGGGYKK